MIRAVEFHMVCDACKDVWRKARWPQGAETIGVALARVRLELRLAGWGYDGGKDFCPKCDKALGG